MTFYHICGLEDPSGTPCQLKVESDRVTNASNLENQTLFEAPDSELFNGPTADKLVNSTEKWKFQRLELPPMFEGSRLSISAEYDLLHGAVGLDAIKVRTRQK